MTFQEEVAAQYAAAIEETKTFAHNLANALAKITPYTYTLTSADEDMRYKTAKLAFDELATHLIISPVRNHSGSPRRLEIDTGSHVIDGRYYHRNDLRRDTTTSITVAATKTPDQVATDIRRRLIPELEATYQLARQTHAKILEREASFAAVIDRITTLAPNITPYHRAPGRFAKNYRKASIDLTVSSFPPHEIELKLNSLSEAQAEQILAILAPTWAEQKESE